MSAVPLLFPFLLAASAAVLGPLVLPTVRLLPFAPFLALACMRTSLLTSLWLALAGGLLIDLLSSALPFGFQALCACLTVLLLHRYKRHFFSDQILSLPLYTVLISAICTLLHLFLGASVRASWLDLIAMPFVDAFYALVWFTAPLGVYAYVRSSR